MMLRGGELVCMVAVVVVDVIGEFQVFRSLLLS